MGCNLRGCNVNLNMEATIPSYRNCRTGMAQELGINKGGHPGDRNSVAMNDCILVRGCLVNSHFKHAQVNQDLYIIHIWFGNFKPKNSTKNIPSCNFLVVYNWYNSNHMVQFSANDRSHLLGLIVGSTTWPETLVEPMVSLEIIRILSGNGNRIGYNRIQ